METDHHKAGQNFPGFWEPIGGFPFEDPVFRSDEAVFEYPICVVKNSRLYRRIASGVGPQATGIPRTGVHFMGDLGVFEH